MKVMVALVLMVMMAWAAGGCAASLSSARADLNEAKRESVGVSSEYVFVIEKAGDTKMAEAVDSRSGGTMEAEEGAAPVLAEERVKVAVDGFLATVEETQRYQNSGAVEELRYVRRVGRGAMMRDLVIRIGQREIRAVVRPREEAEAAYAAAMKAGLKATLIENASGDGFVQRISHVEAGEWVEVRVTYVQTLSWRVGDFELNVPLARAGMTKISAVVAGAATWCDGLPSSPTHELGDLVANHGDYSYEVGGAKEKGAEAFVLRIPWRHRAPTVCEFGREEGGWEYAAFLIVPGKGVADSVGMKMALAGVEAGDVLPGLPVTVPADRPVALIARWKKGTAVTSTVRFGKVVGDTVTTSGEGAELPAVWAELKIRELMREPTAEHKAEARRLGLEFSVVGEGTGLLMVDAVKGGRGTP